MTVSNIKIKVSTEKLKETNNNLNSGKFGISLKGYKLG